MPLEYRAERDPVDGWVVVNRARCVLYDSDGGELTQQEADDLAWAFNHGAQDDDEAIRMLKERYGGDPPWLNESKEPSP